MEFKRSRISGKKSQSQSQSQSVSESKELVSELELKNGICNSIEPELEKYIIFFK